MPSLRSAHHCGVPGASNAVGLPVGAGVGVLRAVGVAVGCAVGVAVGLGVGEAVGAGVAVGDPVGLAVGVAVGRSVGVAVALGAAVGVGALVGLPVGAAEAAGVTGPGEFPPLQPATVTAAPVAVSRRNAGRDNSSGSSCTVVRLSSGPLGGRLFRRQIPEMKSKFIATPATLPSRNDYGAGVKRASPNMEEQTNRAQRLFLGL
jgi:hypothetical protein